MPDFAEDSQPLAQFQQAPEAALKHVHDTKQPVILTVDGAPAAVLQDPKEYERLLDHIEQLEVREAIRRGLEDCDAGRTISLEEAIAFMRHKYDIPG